MSFSFVADTEIAAPAARVWDILMDLPGYAAWNPFTYQAEGRPAVGEDVHLDVDLGWIRVHQVERVRAMEPGHLIAWGTAFGGGLVLRGLRTQRVVPLGPNRCRYETEDRIEGPMTWFVRLAFGPALDRGFRAAADALRARAEGAP